MFEWPQDAYISHASPGRLRVRVPSRKGNEDYFARVRNEFSGVQGVSQIVTNPVTGSILVIHSIAPKTIDALLRAGNLVPPQNLHPQVSRTYEMFDHRVRSFIGRGIDIGALASVALFVAGSYQITKGNFTAIPWYTAFWYGLNVYLRSKPARNGLE